MGDPALGLITSFHYSAAHDSPENKAFLTSVRGGQRSEGGAGELHGGGRLRHAWRRSTRRWQEGGGDIDGDKAMAALKGYKWMSPRGPVMIDPATRDIVQTVYIRKVEKKDGKLANVEFDKIENVKDPGQGAGQVS